MTARSPEIQDHPEYPFRPGEAGAIRAAAACYLGAPKSGTWEDAVLSAFVALGRRFAFLERLIQGDVVCSLPLHTAATKQEVGETPEDVGERLAAGERALLEWETGAAEELASLLDAIGIKVLSPMRKAVDAAGGFPGGSVPLFGAFSFEGSTGPALLVGRPLDQPEASFVLAHEFGHLVADFDPYRSRFCQWDPHSLQNLTDSPEERRADRFARALLMPDPQFRSVVAEVKKAQPEASGSTTISDFVQQLAAIFEVPAALVHRRLEDLKLGESAGHGRLKGAEQAGAGIAGGDSRTGNPAGEMRTESPGGSPEDGQVAVSCLALPERYVNLSLAAFNATILKPETLAAFLDTTQAQAMRIVSWANLPVQERD